MGKICIDGLTIPFEQGQSIIEAAQKAKVYIPHLCFLQALSVHGSCRLCMVEVEGKLVAACATEAQEGLVVSNQTEKLKETRKRLLQMLFVEGNHFCPSCEKAGDCDLQALAYELEMQDWYYDAFFPKRNLDASHPDILLDFDRCIFCDICSRASEELDGKSIFILKGRGENRKIAFRQGEAVLSDTSLSESDAAVELCPVGVFVKVSASYPIKSGERHYDKKPISFFDEE